MPFNAGKTAQRSIVQSIAKHVSKDNIHVSYIIIDSVVDMPLARKFLPDKPDEFFAKPNEIAETVYYLTQQPKIVTQIDMICMICMIYMIKKI